MKPGYRNSVLRMTILPLLLLAPTMVLGQTSGQLDLLALLNARDPAKMVGALKEDMQEKVMDRWAQLLMEDSTTAADRNESELYPNPILQAYVNRLGQSLIPKELSDNIVISFRIVEDPLPYADTLATGTVYLSTGMASLLDNESQLAFLLMHEAGHVMLSHHLQQTIEEEKAQKRATRIKLIGSVAGVLAGGLMGAKQNVLTVGAESYVGFKGAKGGLRVANAFRNHRFIEEIQLESDQFATQILLQHGFDPREAPLLMAKVGNIVRRSGAAVELAFGNVIDLPERSDRVKELLGGPYQTVVARILNGDGFRMSSPRFSQLMAELKRDNGLLALQRDLFIIARANLEEAAAVRTDDPLTMYGLGVLFRTVGRSEQDLAQAASYLISAMKFDEVRHRLPESYLQYAVELLSREDPQRYPEVQATLKNYVKLYQRYSGGALPREMQFVYDYLDLTGDRNWNAYRVNYVSSEIPFQITGEGKSTGNAQQEAKRSPKN